MNESDRLELSRLMISLLVTMVDDGLRGLLARAHVDCAWDWHESGSRCVT